MQRTLDIPRYGSGLLLAADDQRAIDVLEEARDLGRLNLPRTDEHAAGGTQKRIVEHFRGEQRELERRARALVDALAGTCRDEHAVPTPDSLAARWDAADLAIQRLKLESRDALVAARRSERRALRQLSWFRRHHRLLREADYPTSLLLQIGILAALVLSESVANMYFFAMGSELGLLGGLIQALVISLANVGLAVLVGVFCLRNLHHVSAWRRGLAGLGLGFFLCMAVGFNLLVGHYRDLYADSAGAALLGVLPHARAAPFDLTPHSLLLFGVGLAASALGLYKGYTLDDRYPGYGRVDRRYREAEASYVQTLGSIRPRLLQILEEAQASCDATLRTAAARVAEMSQALRGIDDTPRRYAAGLEAIGAECERLLRAFREENAHIRTTPPPAYFDEYPRIQGTLALPSTEPLAARIAEMRERLHVLEAAVTDYRGRLVKRVELEARSLDAYVGEVADQVGHELEAEG